MHVWVSTCNFEYAHLGMFIHMTNVCIFMHVYVCVGMCILLALSDSCDLMEEAGSRAASLL